MKTKNINSEKIAYKTPLIEKVTLDNEISLVLESTPASGPGEPATMNNFKAPEYFNNDPFKLNVG